MNFDDEIDPHIVDYFSLTAGADVSYSSMRDTIRKVKDEILKVRGKDLERKAFIENAAIMLAEATRRKEFVGLPLDWILRILMKSDSMDVNVDTNEQMIQEIILKADHILGTS